MTKQTEEVSARRSARATREEKINRASDRLNMKLTSDAQNRPEAVEAMDRLATLLKEGEKETST